MVEALDADAATSRADRLVELVEHARGAGRACPAYSLLAGVMCGIVGVVRRRAHAGRARLGELRRAARSRRRAAFAGRRRPRRRPRSTSARRRRSRRSTPAAAGRAGRAARLLGDPVAGRVARGAASSCARARARRRRARLDTHGGALAPAELEARQRRARAGTRRGLGGAPRPAAHRARGRRPRRADASVAGRSRRSSRCRSRSSAIDRLEVRGRDSAGAAPPRARPRRSTSTTPTSRELIDARAARPALPHGLGARRRRRRSSFVYKAAAEIGELGDNTAVLRAAIRADDAAAPSRSRPTPPRSWCSVTPAGRASASSPRRTRTRSTRRKSGVAAAPTWWAR